jgi:hypothetical protein
MIPVRSIAKDLLYIMLPLPTIESYADPVMNAIIIAA